MSVHGTIERLGNGLAGHARSHLQDRTQATPLIDDGEDPELPSV
jgi:hypothetical protein